MRTLFAQDAAAGTFRSAWNGLTDDGARAGRGVYFARLAVSGLAAETRKIVLE